MEVHGEMSTYTYMHYPRASVQSSLQRLRASHSPVVLGCVWMKKDDLSMAKKMHGILLANLRVCFLLFFYALKKSLQIP